MTSGVLFFLKRETRNKQMKRQRINDQHIFFLKPVTECMTQRDEKNETSSLELNQKRQKVAIDTIDFPNDTLLVVFSFCKVKTICRSRRVCKHWNNLIEQEGLLKPITFQVSHSVPIHYFLDRGIGRFDPFVIEDGITVQHLYISGYHKDHIAYDIFSRFQSFYRKRFTFYHDDVAGRIIGKWNSLNLDNESYTDKSNEDDRESVKSERKWATILEETINPDPEEYRTAFDINIFRFQRILATGVTMNHNAI